MLKPVQPKGAPIDASDYVAGDDAIERFRILLRIPTVSRDDPALLDRAPFDQWIPMVREDSESLIYARGAQRKRFCHYEALRA